MSAAAANGSANEAANMVANGPANRAANGPTNGPANGPANGSAKGPTNQEITRETMIPQVELMVNTLQSRMKKIIDAMTLMDQETAKRKDGLHQTHRIQTLRRGRVINKGRHPMEKLLHHHMIFTHDVNNLLKKYTELFTQATEVLAYLYSEPVSAPLKPEAIMYGNMHAEYYIRYNELYSKINREYHILHRILRGENSNINQDNHAKPKQKQKPKSKPTLNMKYPVRFTASTVRRIPTFSNKNRHDRKRDLLFMNNEPLKREGASSSLGGTRRKRTKRTHRNRA